MGNRTDWFLKDRFGMFIHWGIYAIPARGEWVRSVERISVEDYQPFFDTFNPIDYDPKVWARTAREAGMKYAVLTAKHHDGFCLFDSKLTDYKATKTPAGRDLIREYTDAFRAEGIRVGLYYSLIDWHHPDYPHFGDRQHPMRDNPAYQGAQHNFDNYLTYMHGQVRELLTNYGKLDIMWFDFSYDDMSGEKWRATDLVGMIRSLQPDLLIDSRLESSGSEMGGLLSGDPKPWSGDFVTPEQIIPPQGIVDVQGRPVPWEACVTMNRNWGYAAGDKDFKDSGMIVRKLVECVSKNGNFLMNVGPDARGRIPNESIESLAGVGTWMDRNGASVYGCGAAGLPQPEWGRFTRNGNKIFAHVYEAPIGPLPLPGIPAESIRRMRLLRDGSELKLSTHWAAKPFPGTAFVNLSAVCRDCVLPDAIDTVIEIEVA